MVYLEFSIPGREEPIRRTWPIAPAVGSRVFLEEVVGEVEVRKIIYGACFDGPLTVSGSCTAAVDCVLYESDEAAGDPGDRAKLDVARGALYEAKNAMEQGEPYETIAKIIIAALDATGPKP